jgi:nitroimidazol reductase NimA-like FMN-containing flavoprotein (pyridoxamine 5'-phosphate oxidase superfamily)
MGKAQIGLVERHKRFLRSLEDCSLATIDESGFPHCVPVGYTYYRGAIYIATYSKTKKVRNVARNPKCCVLVHIMERGRGKGLMIQGTATLLGGMLYEQLKDKIEKSAGWHLERWDIGGHKPDTFLKIIPTKIAEIGRLWL